MAWIVLVADACASPSAEQLAQYRSAGQRLGAMIADAGSRGESQRLRGPAFSDSIEEIARGDRLLGSRKYEVSQIGTLIEICEVAQKASISLIMFGSQKRLVPGMAPEESAAAVASVMDANGVEFQDELARLQPFVLRCFSRLMEPMGEFVESFGPGEFSEVRRQGVIKMRNGSLMLFVGAITSTSDPRYRDEYRTEMLSALVSSATEFASIMPIKQRSEVVRLARMAVDTSSAPHRAKYQEIAETFEKSECNVLCRLE
jgi:hypothetical protein